MRHAARVAALWSGTHLSGVLWPGLAPPRGPGTAPNPGVFALPAVPHLSAPSLPLPVAPMPPAGWIAGDRLPLEGSVRVPLAALGLKKGDQVRVTLTATDYRGSGKGQTSSSEPIVLDITDVSGILAALSETDERSAKQLETIIERQLGVGGTR